MTAYFNYLHRGDPAAAAKATANRLGWLLATADLSVIDADQFRTVCQLFHGIALEHLVDGKSYLASVIADALQQQDDFRDDIADQVFLNDTADSRADFLGKLDREREHLTVLADVIGHLDATACLTLLMRVQEVYAAEGGGLEARCAAVFAKLQSRCQL